MLCFVLNRLDSIASEMYIISKALVELLISNCKLNERGTFITCNDYYIIELNYLSTIRITNHNDITNFTSTGFTHEVIFSQIYII